MKPFIYGLVDPLEPKHVRYVGMAPSNRVRPYEHAKLARRRKKVDSPLMDWIRSIQLEERDPAVLVLEELAEGTSQKFLGFVETCYIKSLKEIGHRLTNVSPGGYGGNNGPVSAETRVKLSETGKGNKSRQGQKRSAEEREKQRISMLRYAEEHPEFAEARRLSQIGRKPSKENVEKRSLSLRGNKNGLGRNDSSEVRAKRSSSLRAYNADPANQAAIAEKNRKQSVTKKEQHARKREAESAGV